MKRLIYLIAVMALFLGQTTQAAETNCEKYGIISAGDYIIQNNVWARTLAMYYLQWRNFLDCKYIRSQSGLCGCIPLHLQRLPLGHLYTQQRDAYTGKQL